MCATRLILPVLALLAAASTAGCGGSGSSSATTSPAPSATAASTAMASASPPSTAGAVKTIALRIRDGRTTPRLTRVEVARGTTVRLVVTADAADEVHVHGYNREVELTAGTPATLQFVADIPGLFEVELHHTDTVLFQLLVR